MRFTYNNVALALVRTGNFVRQPVMSGDGADWCFNRYLLDVWGILNPKATSYAAGPTATQGIMAPQTDVAIRHALLEPRKTLVYADDGGTAVLTSPLQGNTTDAMAGPKPIECSVRPIGGTKTFLIHWVGETFLRDCAGTSTDPIVSNRFSTSHIVGDDHRTTITTAGETRFDLSALENLGAVADAFRFKCIPPCPIGFRRMNLSVQVGTLGDRLQWQTQDVQQYFGLGDNASSKHPDVLDFKAVYSQQTIRMKDSIAPSGMVAESFSISVVGKPQSAKANLLVFAVRMAINRIGSPAGPPVPGNDPIITGVEATEHEHAPLVTFRVEAQRPAAQNAKQGMAGLRSDSFYVDGVTYQFFNPELDAARLAPDLGADNNTRTPTVLAQNFAAVLQAACTAVSPVKGAPSAGSGSGAYDLAQNFDIGFSDGPGEGDLGDDTTRWSRDNTEGHFTEYRIDNKVHVRQNKLQAPITGPVSGSTQYGHSDPKTGMWIPDQPNTKTSEVMMLGLPTATLTAAWTAERVGRVPSIPDPDPSDPNYVLLDHYVQPASVGVVADGQTRVWRVEGCYHYAMLTPPVSGDPITFPVTPNTTVEFGDSLIEDYRKGLVMADDSEAGPGGPGVPLDGVFGNV